MKRVALGVGLISALSLAAPLTGLHAQDAQQVASVEPWTSEELENLLAPVALYPDPILAQVLVAATYPDQVLAAQAYVRAFGPDRIDDQPWEISVKAVAHYTPVLNLMAEGEDWMTALGQAYVRQPRDVMAAVQSLRRMANSQGNLQSTEQQVVVVEREVIRIEPAQPRIIYVPTYDPTVVYFRPVYIARAHPSHWAWGVGYPIGVWLTYDFDWYNHHVYYHGWHRGPRWVVVSRPWVVISPIYIGPRYTTVVINRRVVDRRFDTYRLRGYTNVHKHVTYDRRGPRRDVARGWTGGRGVTPDRYRPARGDDRDDGPNRPSGPNRPNRGDGPDRGDGPNRGDGPARPNGDRPNRGAEPDRVRPIPGAPSRTPAAAQPPKRAVASEGARTPSRPSRETERVSNGTWNPRPTTAGTNAPRTSAPRASAPSATAPRATTPRAATPRASAPRASSPRAGTPKASTPRASAPARSDAPRATARPSAPKSAAPSAAPRSSGSNGRASAPRSSTPARASAPRSSSGGRASAPRSSGGSKGGSSAGRRGGN